MSGKVTVANLKPSRLTQVTHRLETEKRIPRDAPTAFLAQHSSQRVRDGVQVRGNVESPPHQIVTRIHHQGKILGRHDLIDSLHELCLARASCQHNDNAAPRRQSWESTAAGSLQPSSPRATSAAGTNSEYPGRR